jgi:hypothetical protein
MDKDWDSILLDKKKIRLYARTAFERVDKDKSGYIELKELKIILCALAEELGTEVVIFKKKFLSTQVIKTFLMQ